MILVSLMLPLVALALLTTVVHADNHSDAIIQWVRSKGGFFSEKLEIRRMDQTDAASPLGVFAKEDLNTKERLMEIPPSCYISLWDDAKAVDNTEEANWQYENLCLLAHKLMEEMKLGKDSEFAPYIDYLETQKPGQLPAMWSKAGKDLLRKVLTPGSDIVDWIDVRFKRNGCIRPDNPFEEHAVELIVQRGFDSTLIPLWDMVNHDNGRINTDNNPMYSDGGLKVWASKKIQAGEEIYATYDKCVDCRDIADEWGTPEILRDFGFVERYPQRWIFGKEDTDLDVWFELYEKEGSNGASELEVIGYPGEDGVDIDEAGVYFLQAELKRLDEVAMEVLKEEGSVPENEWDAIFQFHQAATTAMTMAIEAAADISDNEL
mmetsp:Transcript_975/g.1613  ORF Transcript_975/g.1613 Transcript_975/m.1613 type:complete len:377 (+) Transcript_975:25-1155(+)